MNGEVQNPEAASAARPPMRGTVVHGDARGRELGFPTANVLVQSGHVPPDGVYAGWLAWRDGRWPAAVSIGTNPTFSSARERRVEVHVLDRADLELYGREVEVACMSRIRGMRRFDSVDELIEAVSADVDNCRQLLGVVSPGSARRSSGLVDAPRPGFSKALVSAGERISGRSYLGVAEVGDPKVDS